MLFDLLLTVAWCPLSMVCGQALEVSASENCYDLQVGDTTIVMHSNIKIKLIGKTHSGGETWQGPSKSCVVPLQTSDNHGLPWPCELQSNSSDCVSAWHSAYSAKGGCVLTHWQLAQACARKKKKKSFIYSNSAKRNLAKKNLVTWTPIAENNLTHFITVFVDMEYVLHKLLIKRGQNMSMLPMNHSYLSNQQKST